jgi:hypothetical protein
MRELRESRFGLKTEKEIFLVFKVNVYPFSNIISERRK